MIRQDRFLLGILVGIGLLVILAVGLSFSRQGAVSYGPEDTPEGVFQNYIIAIGKGDYERAFGYVAPPNALPGTTPPVNPPDFNRFQQYFLGEIHAQLANTGAQISGSRIVGSTAFLNITLIQTSGDPFRAVNRQYLQAQLVFYKNAWKITQAPYPYWSYDWSAPQAKGVPPLPAPTSSVTLTPTR